jgi:hypothetical protein
MKNNALTALTAAAMALPGIQANAAQVADEFDFGYRFYTYEEDQISEQNAVGGPLDRYDIDVNQFNLIAPLSDKFQLGVNYQNERLSGASPWFTLLNDEGEAIQVLSGPTIEDERTDGALTLGFANGRHGASFTVARSVEDDYDSTSFAAEYSIESKSKLATYSISGDVSNDDVTPVDIELFDTRPQTAQSRRSNSVLASYSQILSKSSLVKFGVGFSRKTGFLSDPYKAVFLNFQLQSDVRPESRNARTVSAQFRHFSDAASGALHVDYRFYDDSWDIRSNTLDLAWYQNLGAGFQLIPSIRVYDQTEAFFYEPFYEVAREDGLQSTDYRLSEYGAITYGLKATKDFERWSLLISAEKYESGGSTGFASADVANPGLLDFELFTVGFNIRI